MEDRILESSLIVAKMKNLIFFRCRISSDSSYTRALKDVMSKNTLPIVIISAVVFFSVNFRKESTMLVLHKLIYLSFIYLQVGMFCLIIHLYLTFESIRMCSECYSNNAMKIRDTQMMLKNNTQTFHIVGCLRLLLY